MSESTPRRVHNGCWTCKSRRRKCDLSRPTCQACDQRGLVCEGYELRLRWGSGIASRGRFTGAPEPVITSVPPRPKGRRRDRSREKRRLQLRDSPKDPAFDPATQPNNAQAVPVFDPNIPSPLFQSPPNRGTPYDQELFQEFCSTGVNTLHSTTIHDAGNLLKEQLPILCRQSESLYRICLAFQVSITPSAKDKFFEYFDTALNQFRAELARKVTHLEDGTFAAGLLLCSIGLVHGMCWTMHLQGMYNILQTHGLVYSRDQKSPFRAHLQEAMGIMDLPTFTIGRQSPSLGVWRRYCRYRITTWANLDGGGIEVVSGLPRSLIDLFSCIGEGVSEEDFWNWTGAQGSLHQQQLWEAYRLAGILAVRHDQLLPPGGGSNEGTSRSQELGRRKPSRKLVLPPTEVIVQRILSNVDAIYRASAELEGKGSLVFNAINYPIFVAGLQADIIKNNQELRQVFNNLSTYRQNRPDLAKHNKLRYELLLHELLQEWWERHSEGISIHQLAEVRGIELGLY